jgi:hypothetical protein
VSKVSVAQARVRARKHGAHGLAELPETSVPELRPNRRLHGASLVVEPGVAREPEPRPPAYAGQHV